ncbi:MULTISPECIES: helix-turn-helix domain-containing protein [Nocardia]|uniref:helix-turn-helix domain-containing protein n=1 Tax=Nocardia TaxID=1817 RepID=UPI0013003A5F|nr:MULTISPECIES: helix-turn-helix domain-containing protein [Nocardia]
MVMTPAELQCTRESLGLSVETLSRLIGYDVRRIRRWETGTSWISEPAEGKILEVVAATDVAVERLSATQPSTLVAYKSDEELWADLPEFQPYPAQWHRIVCRRVQDRVPAARIRFNFQLDTPDPKRPEGGLPPAAPDR